MNFQLFHHLIQIPLLAGERFTQIGEISWAEFVTPKKN